MKGRVFVTQQPKPNGNGWVPNLSPATEYGTLHYIFGAEDKPFLSPLAAEQKVAQALSDFDEQKDYVLWPNTGDPVGLMIVMLMLARMGFAQVKVLYWERKMTNGRRDKTNGFYTPITLDV